MSSSSITTETVASSSNEEVLLHSKPDEGKKRKRRSPSLHATSKEEIVNVVLSNPSVRILKKTVSRHVRRGVEDLAKRYVTMSERAARLEVKFLRAKSEELHVQRAQAVLVELPEATGDAKKKTKRKTKPVESNALSEDDEDDEAPEKRRKA